MRVDNDVYAAAMKGKLKVRNVHQTLGKEQAKGKSIYTSFSIL